MTVRIQTKTYDSAVASVKKIFDGLKATLGVVPNLYATIGQSAPALEGYLAFSSHLGRSTLSAREKEQINLFVSESNGCGYCLSAHTLLASQADLNQDDVLRARHGLGAKGREQAILDLVRKLIRTGGTGASAELTRAREQGVSDAEFIEIIGFVASKYFTNAVAILAVTEIDFPKAPQLPES